MIRQIACPLCSASVLVVSVGISDTTHCEECGAQFTYYGDGNPDQELRGTTVVLDESNR